MASDEVDERDLVEGLDDDESDYEEKQVVNGRERDVFKDWRCRCGRINWEGEGQSLCKFCEAERPGADEAIGFEKAFHAKLKTRRNKKQRDPLLDWRCPECTWVNWREFDNKKCYQCKIPRPTDEELMAGERERAKRELRQAARKYKGGAFEARVRKRLEKELHEADTFVQKAEEKLEDAQAEMERVQKRRRLLEEAQQLNTQIASALAEASKDYAGASVLSGKLLETVKNFS